MGHRELFKKFGYFSGRNYVLGLCEDLNKFSGRAKLSRSVFFLKKIYLIKRRNNIYCGGIDMNDNKYIMISIYNFILDLNYIVSIEKIKIKLLIFRGRFFYR